MRDYYDLCKPRMVYGNLLVAAAAFAYAPGPVSWPLMGWTLLGLGMVIASACAFNNYVDRSIDAKMARTQKRGMVTGAVSARGAVGLGLVLILAGLSILFVFTNWVAFDAALAGFITYVFLYTPLKPKTPYALYVGAVAGATPPVAGYTAAAGVFDATAALLFLFLFVWQIPHFLAIAVYRGEEYAAAGVPLFMKGPYTPAQKKLARGIFFGSLIVLLAWCAWLAFA